MQSWCHTKHAIRMTHCSRRMMLFDLGIQCKLDVHNCLLLSLTILDVNTCHVLGNCNLGGCNLGVLRIISQEECSSDAEPSGLVDNAKKRKFLQSWDELPSATKEAYEQVSTGAKCDGETYMKYNTSLNT